MSVEIGHTDGHKLGEVYHVRIRDIMYTMLGGDISLRIREQMESCVRGKNGGIYKIYVENLRLSLSVLVPVNRMEYYMDDAYVPDTSWTHGWSFGFCSVPFGTYYGDELGSHSLLSATAITALLKADDLYILRDSYLTYASERMHPIEWFTEGMPIL